MFEICDEQTKQLLDNIQQKFSHLNGCNIEVVFKTKKSKSKGNYSIAKLVKPQPILKHFYELNNGNELDYIILIDMVVFNALEVNDQKLLLEHTLNYCDVDMDAKDPYKIRGAEVETFYDTIEKTKDDPRWQQRLQDVAASFYED